MTRLLVIGGSDAGISAALRARQVDPSCQVTVVVADAYPNFSICGLPFFVSGETPDWRSLAHRSVDELEAAGLCLLLEHRALAVDAAAHEVQVRGPDGDTRRLPYDRLVIGTGAEPVVPPVEGTDRPGVHVLHTVDHSRAVRAELGGAQSAVVVGGGYIGVEMADALTHRGLDVTLVDLLDEVFPTVDPELGADLAAELVRHGVDVVTGTRIDRIDPDGGRLRVQGGDLDRPADLVVVAAGVRPATDLALSAGAEVGEQGAIRVDRAMGCGVPDVWAAGDCVETWHQLLDRPAYLPLGTTAHKQGRVAGENAVGGRARYAGTLGTQAVKVFDRVVARTGLRHDEAEDAGFSPLTVDVTTDDHKAYYPGATPLRIRLTGDAATHQLLGAQLLGHHGAEVAKRVDVLATALHHRMGVAELVDLDLTYTPPLSSPWDPVQMAAQSWQQRAST